MVKRMADEGRQATESRVTVAPGVYGVVITPGTQLYHEAHQLLSNQFGRVQTGTGDTPSYMEATATVQELTIPIAVCQDYQDANQPLHKYPALGLRAAPNASAHHGLVLGTARVELARATLIESMIALRPGSPASKALEQGIAAEIGSFAALDGLAKVSLLEVIDTIVAVTLRIAHERLIERLWIFPRNGFMSLMRAEIPGLLPPYRFSLCEDVDGWKEDSPRLRQFREMRLRGLGKWPDIFQITRSALEEDLACRRQGVEARREHRDDVERSLAPAMLRAQRVIKGEADALHAAAPAETHRVFIPAAELQHISPPNVHCPSPQPVRHTGFLPFAGATGYEGQYLRDVVQRGGNAALAYKRLSQHFLELAAGQRVLDVGCGSGVDLAALSEVVGPQGRVVGVDHDPQRVDEARAAIEMGAWNNVTVMLGDAEDMTLPSREFDRVRADRVLQHVERHRAALAEMWRVLAPGGILSVVEPDWATIAIAPASAGAEGDDAALSHVLGWCRRHLRHPLIGRELHGLLHEHGAAAWHRVEVVPVAYTFTDWSTVDAVLQLSAAAEALQREQPALADEVSTWLQVTEAASQAGTFFASIPLYFATAHKVGYI